MKGDILESEDSRQYGRISVEIKVWKDDYKLRVYRLSHGKPIFGLVCGYQSRSYLVKFDKETSCQRLSASQLYFHVADAAELRRLLEGSNILFQPTIISKILTPFYLSLK